MIAEFTSAVQQVPAPEDAAEFQRYLTDGSYMGFNLGKSRPKMDIDPAMVNSKNQALLKVAVLSGGSIKVICQDMVWLDFLERMSLLMAGIPHEQLRNNKEEYSGRVMFGPLISLPATGGGVAPHSVRVVASDFRSANSDLYTTGQIMSAFGRARVPGALQDLYKNLSEGFTASAAESGLALFRTTK